VETDKGVNEVDYAAEGTLTAYLCAEGTAVAAGDPIASIQGREESGQPAPTPTAQMVVEVTGLPRMVPSPHAALRPLALVIVALATKQGIRLWCPFLYNIRGVLPLQLEKCTYPNAA